MELGIWDNMVPEIIKDFEPFGILCVNYKKTKPSAFMICNFTHHVYGPCPLNWIQRLNTEAIIPLNIKVLYIQSTKNTFQEITNVLTDIIIMKAPKVINKFCFTCKYSDCMHVRIKLIKKEVIKYPFHI